ncbi:HAD family hydrolase [Pseudomonas viridiflava]|uniref:HAD family hydrolase n=1 Tax=Pseudomonas viridiflava TaxID=33069 RepID=UPI002EBA8FE2|nr:HAD family hydrolase [Pseudomonas viridiflava]MEE3972506.1 HAD family hydrolase [Pseudomonas viridiflava]MEE4017347.1 HAD family hydrolase [Pseudomonas viridiflava]MEE4044480.1 HAD family hydrolase [Pseudomonas viridiflava]
MLPKAVLFDLDNTLTNRALSIERYVKCFLKDFGLVVHADSQAIVRLISQVDNGGYLKAGSAFSSIRQAVGHVLAHELAWRVAQTPQTLSDHWQIHFPRSAVAMSGSELLVAELSRRDIRIAVVSNGAESSRQNTVACLPFASHIDAIFSSEKVGTTKPAPAIFLAAAEHLQVRPEECWFVGDHPVNDYLGACSAGMHAVWLRGFHDWPQEMGAAPVSISSLHEVVGLLNEITE